MPGEDEQRGDEVDIASEDSFPASDPPAFTPSTIGAPVRTPADVAPSRRPAAPAPSDEDDPGPEHEAERSPCAGDERGRRSD